MYREKLFVVSTVEYDTKELYKILEKYELDIASSSKDADTILAIGGDATVLKASKYNLPIIAWNQGTLGFLTTGTDIEEILSMYTKGSLMLEMRNRLYIETPITKHHVLNEVAIVGSKAGRLVEINLDIDNKRVTTYKGDGLIVATSTGSTAWSLSSGGSLVENAVASILLTPMNPFTMNVRPLVISTHHTIHLSKVEEIILDGHATLQPARGEVTIRSASNRTFIYKQSEETFFDAIINKLGWNNNIKS